MRAAAGIVGAALALAACNAPKPGDPARQVGPDPWLPAPHQYLFPPVNVPKIIGWGAAKPVVAPGLAIAALARNLNSPRSVLSLPDGDVLVVETHGPGEPVLRPKEFVAGLIEAGAHSQAAPENRILLLRGGQASVFIDHLNAPFGIALVGADLYVADTDALLRFPYEAGATRITAPPTVVTPLPAGRIDHHWTKSLVASADGSKLFVGVGSNSNVGENGLEAERERASIWQIDPATGAHRLYATGLRNPAGLAIEPTAAALWAVVNERDELGPDLPPDYLTSVRDGAFYGWPYSWWGGHVDPRVAPQRPDLVAHAVKPDYALSSHVAPLGLVFIDHGPLARVLGQGALVAEHGSWNRQALNGYKVVFIPFAGGRPTGPPLDVITGFLASDKTVHGRPVGLAIDRSGALLIADDAGNAVWRVTAAPAPGAAK